MVARSVFERAACDRVVAGVIGESDCERLQDGFVAQPVLMWTSLAYLVAAVALVATTRIAGDRRGLGWAFVVSLGLIGVGSVLFHGPQPDGTRWIHDVPVVACLLAIVAVDTVACGAWTSRRAMTFWAAAVAATGLASAVAPDVALVVGALAAVAVLVAEIVVGRPRHTWVPILAVAVLAAVVNLLGRTGAPLCDPDAVLQWHGVWHVLTAVGFVLWGQAALGEPGQRSADGSPSSTTALPRT